MNTPTVTFKTTSHGFKSMGRLLWVMVIAGMAGMFLLIVLSGNVILAVVGLIAPMLLVIGFTSGSTEYSINEEGLSKHLTTYLRNHKVAKQYPWSAVKSYKIGSDLSRSYGEYNYLEINFAGNDTWQLTDQKGKTGFENFKQAFLRAVAVYNAQDAAAPDITMLPHPPIAATGVSKISVTTTPTQKIEQKKTFYETPWAKVFLGVMALWISGVMGFLFLNPEYGSVATTFRLLFIIMPGMAYIYYRVYVKRR